MIPEADQTSGYLPPGVHQATWDEVYGRWVLNSHRSHLMEGLKSACYNLAEAGCRELLLDGSFITTKPLPGDYDAAWETTGVDPELLDPVLLDFDNQRAAMKSKYLGDLFPASWCTSSGVLFRDFFRTDRNGVEKGIVLIELGSLT